MSGSNTLGATIKLEGEKAYREAITKINSSLKVMASEMSKVSAEFSKNDKSTASLTAQSKILSSQIEAQKGKIATLRGALEESSKKYGENDNKTNTWRTSLNRAEAELIKMENSLKDVRQHLIITQNDCLKYRRRKTLGFLLAFRCKIL